MNEKLSPLPPVWDGERDETLVCTGLRQETHDVRTFSFAAPEPRLFRFLPGQFMTLDLPAIGQQRCYTIASAPTRPFRLEVTVKRSGPASTWLHDTLRPGMRLGAVGPAGDFTPGAEPRGRYLFLAAGSGITPLMSMARTAHDLGTDADIVLLQCARSPADLLFTGELQAMAARPDFRTASLVETAEQWDGLRGRLSAPALAAMVPDLLTREVFCCGPAPFMANVRALLDAAGFDRARYHEESFAFAPGDTIDQPADVAPAEERPATSTFQIVFSRTGRTVSCPGGATILAAARAAGLRLPSACGKGVCGTCKSKLREGAVDMAHGGGIRQREIDAGQILLCCSKPLADLVIER